MGNVDSRIVTSSDELQEILLLAQQLKTAVHLYRQGNGGIQLDFSQWKEIEQFDADNLMIIAPPGLKLQDLNAAIAAQGLRFIPADSPAFAQLSVGEWAYRGCPNLSAWKYGAGKHFLLGASYVLPNGEIVPVGGKCIKNVSGYDFTRFLTGAYADLAVGVQYVIKLMPQPACRIAYHVELASLSDAIKLVGMLHNHPVPPVWLFWMDQVTGEKLTGGAQAGHRIMFELDGNEAEVREYAETVERIFIDCNVKIVEGQTAPPDLSGLEKELNEFWLLDEFKIPYPQVGHFAAEADRLLVKAGCRGGLFGQLADGKIHLYAAKEEKALTELVHSLQNVARNLGGTASGKYQRLYQSGLAGKLMDLEKAFKRRYDPAGILNRSEEVSQ